MTDARAARHLIAQELAAADLNLVSVYSSPPEQMASPSLVISPGMTYLALSTFGSWELQLRLIVTVPRTSGSGGLDELDTLLASAHDVVLDRLKGVTIGPTEDVGVLSTVGGAELLAATVGLKVDLDTVSAK